MATPAQITALKQLYTGIFGFLPTTEAFDWYAAQIDRLGLDTAGLANVLLYDDLQAGASNTFDYSGGDLSFVRQIYQNLFGWTDAALELAEHVEGVAYWTNQLNGVFGGDKGKLIEAMIWVVETTGLNSADVSTQQAFALLQNYLEVSTYALEQAKAAGEDLDLDVLRSAYDVVTGNAASVAEAKTLIDTRGKAIYGTDASETLNGTYRNDAILGLTGDDVINAGAGNDWINTGVSGNNVVTAGKGNDQIEGGPQDDVYIFNRGDGQDVLFDHGGNDTFQLNGIPAADVALLRQGNDLVLDFGGGDQVKLNNQFGSGYDLETLQIQGEPDIDLAALVAKATAAGNLQEGEFYSLTDLLAVEDVPDVPVVPDVEDDIVAWLLAHGPKHGLTGGVFGEADAYHETDGWFYITGTNDHDIVRAAGSDDRFTLRGYGGSDLLIGGDGVDQIFGSDNIRNVYDPKPEGDDILYGGKDADYLWGSSGNDTYVFARGDGRDLLMSEGSFDVDTFLFGKGITVQDILLAHTGWITLYYTSEDRVDLNGCMIEELQFLEDGTTIDFVGIISAFDAAYKAGELQKDIGYHLTDFL
jgi:Ca2+-binding RTX toxin-like protein